MKWEAEHTCTCTHTHAHTQTIHLLFSLDRTTGVLVQYYEPLPFLSSGALFSSLFFMMLYVVLSLISKSSVVSATSQSTNSLPYQGRPLDDPDLLLFPALQPNKHPWLPSETLCNASSFPSTVSRVRVLPHAWNTCSSYHVCHIPEWD